MSLKITVKSEVKNRMSPPNKNGQVRQVFWQDAELNTDNLRMQFELEIDGPAFAQPVGETFDWDIEADVVPGPYGPQLARRQSLRKRASPAAKAAA